MTHRDGLSALSVRSQYRRDALHHKMLATRSDSTERPPSGRFWDLSEGVSKPCRCYGIARGLLPTRQVPEAIPMGHYYHPLVLSLECLGAGFHELDWVQRLVPRADLVVQVGPGAAPGVTQSSDLLPALDLLSVLDQDLAEVGKARRDAMAVVDLDRASVAIACAREHDPAGRRCTDA